MAPVVSALAKYKLVFLGDQAVGKTAIITRFMYDKFDATYQGYSWAGEVPELDPKLHQGFFCGSDCLRYRQSFLSISKWIEEVNTQRGGDVIIVLVGNKTDLVDKRQISTDEGEAKAQEHGAMFMETSAKAGFNIKPLFRKIAASLPGMEALSSAKQEDMVDINLRPAASGQIPSGAEAQEEQKAGGCSC
ncbi:Os03g0191400 [Oryza sativa Japonica Group]|uniref:Os03g0191400 protein n=1 Tax=Oryza sativa subsp. japonica TaxID=39947 RepID=Q0DUE1_ORYSJ|nr:hypothetical protein OsJ_09728 [Oryza sativa Japonica Group]BAF11147.1 Os03g0191400 [Oryza sativa Japonica Group]|eukprot:NP_001049233.1 Os03g0191400 [Oryza sativa Japonica Group]